MDRGYDSSKRKGLAKIMENDTHQSELQEKVGLCFARFIQELKAISQKMDKFRMEAINLALMKGWFLCAYDGFHSINGLIDRLAEAGEADIDVLMLDYYRSSFPWFSEELLTHYPDRKAPIEAAVRAHRQGEFHLSIPVFLAQADGIQESLNKTQIKKKFEDSPRELAYLTPWFDLKNSVLTKNEGERKKYEENTGNAFNFLNRHQIMHGEVFDYGTEVNSLKAFSFLVFAGLHIRTILKKTCVEAGGPV